MSTTCKLIQKITLSSDLTSVVFSNIPAIYTDLYLVVSARSDFNQLYYANLAMRFNNDSNNLYSWRSVYGLDGSAASENSSSQNRLARIYATSDLATPNTFGNSEAYIPNYRSSSNKIVHITSTTESNIANGPLIMSASGLWAKNSEITSIDIALINGINIKSGSSFYLYGIARVDDNSPGRFGIQATGGQEVYESGGYRYHIFKSSGTFTVNEPGWVETLVVSGGGGGGIGYPASNIGAGGGGGAGGLLQQQRFINAQSYSVIVGAGGSGGNTSTVSAPTNGNQSSITTIVSSGGGAGSSYRGDGVSGPSYLPQIGGSGGGGSYSFFTGASGISGQGNAGGSCANVAPQYGTGGGGGAGSVGQDGSGSSGGNGGSGLTVWGSSYAGGGAGGGGEGVGGTATFGGGSSGNSGTPNTGGGGGGASQGVGSQITGSGGSGGSGIVIIRYPI